MHYRLLILRLRLLRYTMAFVALLVKVAVKFSMTVFNAQKKAERKQRQYEED